MTTVYLIESYIEGLTYYKIGFTRAKDPTRRLKQLQTGSVNDLKVLKVFRTKYGTKLEKTLHRRYQSYKVRDEWFDLPVELVENFQDKCKQIEDNFDILTNNNVDIL